MHIADTPIRIPAAIAYIWSPAGEFPEQQLGASGAAASAAVLGPGQLAIAPSAGNSDVVEAAIFAVRALMDSAPDTIGAEPNSVSALIFPGLLEQRGNEAKLVSDGLLDDLRKAPPELHGGQIHLTGHATRELETPWLLEQAPTYTGASGRSRTLWQVKSADTRGGHCRNPTVLRQPSALVATEALAEVQAAIDTESVTRVLGAVGVGKSRLTSEALRGAQQLWTRCWTDGSSNLSLAVQLAQQLTRADRWPTPRVPAELLSAVSDPWHVQPSEEATRTLLELVVAALTETTANEASVLVIDDAHQASSFDQQALEQLLSLAADKKFKILLLGRHAAWLDWQQARKIEIEPLTIEKTRELTDGVTRGLQLPTDIKDRFLEACQGNPFAIEEGLHNLVRRRLLRLNYGNFFFSGPKDAKYLPTARLARHLLAEAMRVDGVEACFRLASATNGAPKELLALSSDTDEGRLQLLCNIGLFTETQTEQHVSLSFASPAFRTAFSQCMEHHVVQRLRGELLEPIIGGGSAEEAWSAYQQLAGTPKAIDALLEVLARPRDERPTEGLFTALQRELEAHSARQGDTGVEFELLWAYLPLARKFGETSALIPHIERALALCAPGEPRRMALLALHSEEAMVQGELDAAERRAVEGIDLARKQDPRRQSILLLQLGKVLRRQDRHPEAKKLLVDLLRTIDSKSSPSQWAACSYHLGNVYLHEQDFEAALEHHQSALQFRREKGSPTTLGHSLSALATLNLAVGNYSQSLALYHEALDVLEEAPDPAEQAFPLVGIGKALARLGNFAGATAPLKMALELRKRRSDKLGIEISKLTLAQNDSDLGHSERALQETRLALFRLVMLGSSRYRGDAESLIGQLLLQQNKPKEALERLKDAATLHHQARAAHAALFDEAHALTASISLQRVESIAIRARSLAERLTIAPYPELGERLDLKLYEAWKALESLNKRRGGEASVPIQRAFLELCRKTAMLEPERRNRFLQQVPSNRRILRHAQEEGLADPEQLEELMRREQAGLI